MCTGEIGGRANTGEVAEVYGVGFAAGSLAAQVEGGSRIEVCSDKKLMEVGRQVGSRNKLREDGRADCRLSGWT